MSPTTLERNWSPLRLKGTDGFAFFCWLTLLVIVFRFSLPLLPIGARRVSAVAEFLCWLRISTLTNSRPSPTAVPRYTTTLVGAFVGVLHTASGCFGLVRLFVAHHNDELLPVPIGLASRPAQGSPLSEALAIGLLVRLQAAASFLTAPQPWSEVCLCVCVCMCFYLCVSVMSVRDVCL